MRTNHCQRDTLHGKHATHAARSAFTLVELMVVVGIIGLLVAITLPAVSAAWDQAKAAATAATLNVLETGVTQFFADTTVGGAYPPSTRFWDGDVASPHTGEGLEQVGGANFLAWATAGADLLGTPGFRDLENSDPTGGLAPWADDVLGLYELDGDGGPLCSRSGPYVELSKMKFPKGLPGAGFQVPVGSRAVLDSTVFLDSFDQPILYYRANRNAQLPVNDMHWKALSMAGPAAQPIYNRDDNAHITGGVNAEGIDLGAGVGHFPNGLGPTDPLVKPDPSNPADRNTFAFTVWNPNVTALHRPHRADSFILLSAGRDGLYGTADDIGNFPINK